MRDSGQFLVHQEVLGHHYGIASAAVRKLQAMGKLPLLDLDRVQDVEQLRASGFLVRRPEPGTCVAVRAAMPHLVSPQMVLQQTLSCWWNVFPSTASWRTAYVVPTHLKSSMPPLQASYLYLQPHSLEALQARIKAEILANPPLLYEPEEAAAKAAAEAVKEAEAAAAKSELFEAVVPLDQKVSTACSTH